MNAPARLRLAVPALCLGLALLCTTPATAGEPTPGPAQPQAGYYTRRVPKVAASPAPPASPDRQEGRGGTPAERTERRLVYEFLLFDVLLCIVTVVVIRDAWLSDPMRRHDPDAAPRPPLGGGGEHGGAGLPQGAPTSALRRLQVAAFGTPRGIAGLSALLVVVSVTVTLVFYGSLLKARLVPGTLPGMAPRSLPVPFASSAPAVTRPYRMPDLLLATSPDGETWSKAPGFVAARGGTHKMVAGSEGTVWAYVADERHRLERATVTPGGLVDLARVEIAPDQPGLALDPCVVPLPAGAGPRFRLYYLHATRPGDPADASSRNEIVTAVSDDGLHFRQEEGVRLEGMGVTDPDVVRLADGSWRMYYTQAPGVIKSARSTDGLRFSLEGLRLANAWVSSSRVDADGSVRLFFGSLDSHAKGMVRAAASRDGLSFVVAPHPSVSAGTTGARDRHGAYHPAVVQAPDGRYWMLYSSGPAFTFRGDAESPDPLEGPTARPR